MNTPAFTIPTYSHTALPSVTSTAPTATAPPSASPQLPPASSAALVQRQASAHAHNHDAHGHSHSGASIEHDEHGQSHGNTAHGHSHPTTNSAHGHSHSATHARSHSNTAALANYSSSSSSSSHSHSKPLHIAVSVPFVLSLLSSSDTQPSAVYLAIKLSYTLLLLVIGLLSLSTHLTSLAFKQLFDCAAIVFSLYARLLTRSSTNTAAAGSSVAAYSYGYGRHELVAAFTNAIFLFFVATFTAIELFHAVTSAEGADSEGGVSWLVVLGLLLGVASGGLLLRWSSCPSARSSHDVNMHSLWLFAVNDCLTHGFTLLATLLPAVSPSIHPASLVCLLYLTHACSLVYLTVPLFVLSSSTLLQRTPPQLQQQLDRAMRSVSFLDGVLEVRSSHFWCVGLDGCVGSVSVRVREGVDEAAVRREVRDVLGKCVTDLTVQVEKDVQPAWMSGQME